MSVSVGVVKGEASNDLSLSARRANDATFDQSKGLAFELHARDLHDGKVDLQVSHTAT